MDIIDIFLERHGGLRAELASLAEPFRRPHGVGWDDCVSLDCQRLRRDIEGFFASFRAHEASEEEFMAEIAGQFRLEPATKAAFEDGRRAVADIMKLFGAVAFTFDGEHVHRLRELLGRMTEEVEAHLAYEEKILFPLLKERLPAARLREMGERAREAGLHPPSAR